VRLWLRRFVRYPTAVPGNSTQSFLRGVASILDFGDTLTPRLTPTDTPEVWDALAL
jgi:hypothetical protein